jgi:hypothetical protein
MPDFNQEEQELLLNILERAHRGMLQEYGRTDSIRMHRALDHDEAVLRVIIEKLQNVPVTT